MLNDRQKYDMVMEAFDPQRVTVTCGKHMYFGPVKGRPEIKPNLGCADCWRVFYIHELADCPPDKRREKLEEIEEVMHQVVELVEKGKWDVNLLPHAHVEIGKE